VETYPRSVLTVLFARLDRRIADLMLARARRRWPLLRLVPQAFIRPVVLPAATLARQDVVRVAVVVGLIVGTLLALIPMF
jgi:hypothetical protein